MAWFGVDVDTEVMGRRSDGAASDLETIDLGGDVDVSQTPPENGASRRLTVALLVAIAFVVIAGLAFLVGRSSQHRDSSPKEPATRTFPLPLPTSAPVPVYSTEPLLGRFYPVLDRTGATTIVLPTGLTFTLSRGASFAIKGLGGTFFGTVTPKGAACCALSFDLLHAAPSDLFANLGPASAISGPVLVRSTDAVQPDVRQVHGRLGVLSTGDWTLTASFEDGDHTAEADAFVLQALASWHLVATPYGAVLRVPAGSTVDNSEADFGRVPDLSNKAIDFVRSDPCQIGPTPQYFGTVADTTGRWCRDGLAVTIEGQRSYVRRAIAALEITRPPNS
jgi:hypothetical protein